MFDDFKKLLIATFCLAILVVALAFILIRSPEEEDTPIIIEDEIDTQSELEALAPGNQTQIILRSFGGEKNVKTFFENDQEYALSRNPNATGDLELILIEPFGNYYYTEENEERIVYKKGSEDARYGYNEIASITQEPLRELNSDTEFFIAYPDSLSAGIAGITQIPDSGSSNRFLETQLAIITNINNNITVIAEIVHRGEEQGILPVSERVLNSLKLDDGALGNLEISLINRELAETGVIIPARK